MINSYFNQNKPFIDFNNDADSKLIKMKNLTETPDYIKTFIDDFERKKDLSVY